MAGGIRVDWEILEPDGLDIQDEALQQLNHGHHVGAPKRSVWSRRPRISAIIGLCLFAGLFWGGQQLWIRVVRVAERGLEMMENDVRIAVDSESWLAVHGSRIQLSATIDADADPVWRADYLRSHMPSTADAGSQSTAVRVDDITLREDTAKVEVTVAGEDSADRPNASREVRFYRITDDGWRRTSPRSTFWGPTQRTETSHFILIHRKWDSDVVESAGRTIDAEHERILRQLGVSDVDSSGKIMISIVPQNNSSTRRVTNTYIRIPSPHLIPAPVDADESDSLVAELRRAFSRRAVIQAMHDSQIGWQWGILAEGIEHAIRSPEAEPRYRGVENEQVTLRSLLLSGEDWFYDGGRVGRIQTAEALARYIMVSHGDQYLAELFQSLDDHDDWSTAIPAVFNMSAAEFEAEWQRHYSEG